VVLEVKFCIYFSSLPPSLIPDPSQPPSCAKIEVSLVVIMNIKHLTGRDTTPVIDDVP